MVSPLFWTSLSGSPGSTGRLTMATRLLDRLPALRINFTGRKGICSAAALENLFKSEQAPETQIALEIENEEIADGITKVHGK